MPKLPVVKVKELLRVLNKLEFLNTIGLAVMPSLNILMAEELPFQFITARILKQEP